MALFESIPCRWSIAVFTFFYFSNIFITRINISLAIVAMVNRTAGYSTANDVIVNHSMSTNNTARSETELSPHADHSSSSLYEQGTYDWNESIQGFILAAFYYGYMFSQVPGGRLAERIGARKVLGYALLVNSLFTLLIPVGASLHYSVVIVIRVFIGLAQGTVFPAGHCLISKWAPPLERSRFIALSYTGCMFGIVSCLWLSGTIIYYIGWESVFYISGALGLLMWLVWTFRVYDYPADHPNISEAERDFILTELKKAKAIREGIPAPVKQIMTSVAVWTLVICDLGNNWSFFCFTSALPTYMKHILRFDIKSNGFISGLPYLLRWICGWCFAFLADTIRKRNWLSEIHTRKLYTSLAFFVPAVTLALVSYIGDHPYIIVALIVFGIGINGMNYSAYSILHLVIAPNFAGTMMGISNGIGTLSGMIAPVVVGFLTNNQQTVEQWRIVFWIATCMYAIAATQFLVLGTDQVQEWNNPKEEPVEENNLKEMENNGQQIK